MKIPIIVTVLAINALLVNESVARGQKPPECYMVNSSGERLDLSNLCSELSPQPSQQIVNDPTSTPSQQQLVNDPTPTSNNPDCTATTPQTRQPIIEKYKIRAGSSNSNSSANQSP